MSGAEGLAILGSIAASVKVFKTGSKIILWVLNGPSSDQIVSETVKVQLCVELLPMLKQFTARLELLVPESVKQAIDNIHQQLKVLQEILRLADESKQKSGRNRLKHVFKGQAQLKEFSDQLSGLQLSLILVYVFSSLIQTLSP